MDEISVDESLEFYLDTLGYLDEKYVNGSDKDIEYYIIEELDADAHTFLHNYTVGRLIEAGLIPKSVEKDSENLRTLVKELINKKNTVKEIRFDRDWKLARQMARKILTEIKIHRESKNN